MKVHTVYKTAPYPAILALALLIPQSDAFAVDYQYDALGRLIQATYANGQSTQYSHDAGGNLLTIDVSGTGVYPGLSDLTANLDIAIGGLRYSRRSRTYRGLIELRNVSQADLVGPFTLQFANLSASATLVNSTGENDSGPWLNTDPLTLSSGEATSVLVEFTNTNRQFIDYQIQVFGSTN